MVTLVLLLFQTLIFSNLGSSQTNSTTSSSPPPKTPPPFSPPLSPSSPTILPNQAVPVSPPPPPLSTFCPLYLSQVLTDCGSDLFSGSADFSAPSCCGSIFQANQAKCFSTVVGSCTLSSSTLENLVFICGLANEQLYLPTGAVCLPSPPPPRPPVALSPPPLSSPPTSPAAPQIIPAGSNSTNSSNSRSNVSETVSNSSFKGSVRLVSLLGFLVCFHVFLSFQW